MKIQIVDSETGQTVFDDTITGTSFSILLERDFDSFDIYISNIDNQKLFYNEENFVCSNFFCRIISRMW